MKPRKREKRGKIKLNFYTPKMIPGWRRQIMRRKHEEWEGEMPPGGAARVAVSIVAGVGWLIFLILFLAFYADGFSIYQNLAIILASLLVVGAILGPIWAHWGIKTGRVWKKKKVKRKRKKR